MERPRSAPFPGTTPRSPHWQLELWGCRFRAAEAEKSCQGAPTPSREALDGDARRAHSEVRGKGPTFGIARNTCRLGHFRWRRPAGKPLRAGSGLKLATAIADLSSNLSKAVVAGATTAPQLRCRVPSYSYHSQHWERYVARTMARHAPLSCSSWTCRRASFWTALAADRLPSRTRAAGEARAQQHALV